MSRSHAYSSRLSLAASLAIVCGAGFVQAQETIPPEFRFDGAFTSLWLPSAAQQISIDESNRIPVVFTPPPLAPDLYIWDHWVMRNTDGSVAVIDGYVVLIGLTAEKSRIQLPGQRHGIARWRYFYSNGNGWTPGGLVFEEGSALGGRQWAGSTVYDPETRTATFYYTALGDLPASAAPPLPDDASVDCFEEIYYSGSGFRRGEGGCSAASDVPETPEELQQQAIASTTATVASSPTAGVAFQNFTAHRIILSAGGRWYTTAAQSKVNGSLYVFRDPWFFRDPADEQEYLLFSATSTINPGRKGGVIGLARRTDANEWELLPPLIGGLDVNSQLERPHLVVQDERFYLFFTSHSFSFAEGLSGPEGLYGMVSDSPSLRGHYVPLNGSGLVLANPDAAPLQTYSWLVLPGGRVLSFINYFDLGDVQLAEIKNQSPQFQREHFGGTPAPLLRIVLDGETTSLAGAVNPSGP